MSRIPLSGRGANPFTEFSKASDYSRNAGLRFHYRGASFGGHRGIDWKPKFTNSQFKRIKKRERAVTKSSFKALGMKGVGNYHVKAPSTIARPKLVRPPKLLGAHPLHSSRVHAISGARLTPRAPHIPRVARIRKLI